MAFDVVNDPGLIEQLGDPKKKSVAAPFSVRAGASIKMTPAGKVGYLESKYGQGNVSEQNGNLLVRQDGEWRHFDEPEFTLNDVADWTGGAIEAVAPLGAGIATANPLAVGAAGAAGNAMRQFVSSQLPGDDEMSLGDRAAEVATTGLVEGAAQGAGNLLFAGMDKIRPHNLLANAMNRVPNRAFSDEGVRLENWMRQDSPDFGFTLGQQTGSRGRLMIEGLGRRHILAADDLAALDRQQIADSVQKLNKIMDRITPNTVSHAKLGDEVKDGFANVSRNMVNARSVQGEADFKRAWMLSQGEKNIPVTRLKTAYKNALEDLSLPGASGGVDSLANQVSNWMEEVGAKVDARHLQKLMAKFGKVAHGDGNLFPLHQMDKADQRAFAGRLLRALEGDLSDAIDTGIPGADLLKHARDNWKMNSDAIMELKNTVLGRYLKDQRITPEVVVEKILKMKPSELKETAGVLENISPELYAQAKREMIESFKSRSKVAESVNDAMMGGELNLSSSKLATQIRDHADEINAFFGKGEAKEMENMLGVLSRLSDRAKTEGSPTGTINMLFKSAGQMMSLNPADWARSLATLLGPRQLVRLVVNPQARRSLMQIKEAKTWTKGLTAGAGYVAWVLNSEDSDSGGLTMPPQTLLSGQNLLSQ